MIFDFAENIREVRCRFIEGTTVFYASLIPDYNWLTQTFSIAKIINPVKTEVINHAIFSEQIDQTERFELSKHFNNIIRKYSLHLYFENLEDITLSLFVDHNQKVLIKYETNIIVNENEEIVKRRFYKEIIRLEKELKVDKQTTIIRDDNFNDFIQGWEYAINKYPEEVI